MKTIIKWFFLLNKRLYKKITFLSILALIPISVFSLMLVAKDNGFIHIALSQVDKNDTISNSIINELLIDNNIIHFTYCDQPNMAINKVKNGEVDAAWIFPENVNKKLKKFISSPTEQNYIVNVVEREQNVVLRFSLEKLSGLLYKHFADDIYIDYIRTNISEYENIPKNELLDYYDSLLPNNNLFKFSFPYSEQSAPKTEINYLIAPIRGLLSVIIMLCGLATAMFYIQDEKYGTFSWVPLTKKIYIEFGCQMISIINIAIIVIITLLIARLSVNLMREILVMLLYAISCSCFCMIIRRIFNKIKLISAITPLLTILMIAICPVFFDLKSVKSFQLLFPPTYYINAVTNNTYLLYMLVYILILLLIIVLLYLIQNRQGNASALENY